MEKIEKLKNYLFFIVFMVSCECKYLFFDDYSLGFNSNNASEWYSKNSSGFYVTEHIATDSTLWWRGISLFRSKDELICRTFDDI